ncbi:MAG: Na+/H+ antiporter, partial [Verrucomicrobia bacterium]
HVSGILAVVTAGIYLGWHGPIILSSRFRLQAFAVWEMVVFLLNGFVFITIGLQLPGILRELRGESIGALIDDALLVSGAAVLVRIGWVFVATYLPRSLSKQVRERDPYPDWR